MTRHQNVRPGQLWRSSDPRRFRIVRVLFVLRRTEHGISVLPRSGVARVENIVTGLRTDIDLRHFCTGDRGYSLERESTVPTMKVQFDGQQFVKAA